MNSEVRNNPDTKNVQYLGEQRGEEAFLLLLQLQLLLAGRQAIVLPVAAPPPLLQEAVDGLPHQLHLLLLLHPHHRLLRAGGGDTAVRGAVSPVGQVHGDSVGGGADEGSACSRPIDQPAK